MSIYSLKQRKLIALILIIVLGLFIAYSLKEIVSAILGAVVLYTLFYPLFIWLSEKKKLNRSLGAVIIILLSFMIIVLPFASLFWMLFLKIMDFKNNPAQIISIVKEVDKFFAEKLHQPNLLENSLQRITEFSLGFFSGVFDTLLGILLILGVMYFLLYYMLVKHEALAETLIRYLPFRETNIKHFAVELKNVTYSNVVGQGIIALVQGGLLAVGFVIFGLPDPVFWGIVCFFLSFLPVIGSPVVFLPAGIFALTSGDTFGGVGILLWGAIVVMNIDNVLRMFINKKMGNIHPLVTIIGVVIGIPMFGLLGLVYGPLLLAFFILLIRVYEAGFSTRIYSEKEKVVEREDLEPES